MLGSWTSGGLNESFINNPSRSNLMANTLSMYAKHENLFTKPSGSSATVQGGQAMRQFDKCLAKDQLLPLLKGHPGSVAKTELGPEWQHFSLLC